jgi:hypothetical protein
MFEWRIYYNLSATLAVDRFGHEMYKIHFQPTKGKGCAIFDRKDEQFDFVSKDTC